MYIVEYVNGIVQSISLKFESTSSYVSNTGIVAIMKIFSKVLLTINARYQGKLLSILQCSVRITNCAAENLKLSTSLRCITTSQLDCLIELKLSQIARFLACTKTRNSCFNFFFFLFLEVESCN